VTPSERLDVPKGWPNALRCERTEKLTALDRQQSAQLGLQSVQVRAPGPENLKNRLKIMLST
jgi:hypothetical protein